MIKNEDDEVKELFGTDFCSTCDPFPYSCDIEDSEYDNESTKFDFMGKSERNLMALEVEVKRLTDRIRDQKKIYLIKGNVPTKKRLLG